MTNNLNENIVTTFSDEAVNNRRRTIYLSSEKTIGKMHYTVVSTFPTHEENESTESVADKIAYLINGEKVNRKSSNKEIRINEQRIINEYYCWVL